MYIATSLVAIATLAAAQLTNWEQIHQTLHRYAPAIDMKNFGQLDQVFAPNAVANYTGPLSNLQGLPAIKAGLAQSVTGLQTQHLLGTTVIDIANSGAKTANSTTYFQASLFADSGNNLTTFYGFYTDDLSKGKQGWRIEKRQLVFQGTALQRNANPGPPTM